MINGRESLVLFHITAKAGSLCADFGARALATLIQTLSATNSNISLGVDVDVIP
jgi:hypothetical protein